MNHKSDNVTLIAPYRIFQNTLKVTLRNIQQFRHVLFVSLLCLISTSTMATLRPLTDLAAFQTIMVEGEDLAAVLGEPIDKISLAAVIDDEMEPVPYQIDEYNSGGAVFFENWSVPIDGVQNRFDKVDKLLFLQKDAGSRRKAYHRFDGEFLAEVALTGEDGITRYVYVIKGSRLRSEEQYVRYSAEDALVETDFYSLTYNPENHVIWDDFTLVNYIGDENPLDALKLRMDTGLITSFSKTTLNNNQIVAVPAGEHIGPIRATTQMDLTLWLLKMPMLQVSLQIHHYPKSIVYDVRMVIPEVRRKLLVNPTLSMSLDANNLLGTSVRTALGPKQAGIVDGEIGEVEQQLIEAGLTATENWIWASTHRNLDIVAFFDFLGDTDEPLSTVYVDDKLLEDLPERFVGQLPNMGYKIENLPDSGFFGFATSLYISNGFKGEPESFTKAMRTMPEIVVRQVLKNE